MNGPTLLERLAAYAPILGTGAATTLLVAVVAIVGGFLLGALLLGCTLTGGKRSPLRLAVIAYISFFRGTPMLVQLLMLFYLPSALGVDLPPLLAAMVAMALNSAAFQCEILRSGLAAVGRGQLEAGAVFGLTPRQVFRHIQLPQMARAVWPAVVSEAIDVIKNSAIVSVIAVSDLARAARQIVAGNYRPLEVYVTTGAVYLALTAAVFLLGTWLAHRMAGSRHASRAIIRRNAIRKI
jgi:polar amino acid transport system permease protein